MLHWPLSPQPGDSGVLRVEGAMVTCHDPHGNIKFTVQHTVEGASFHFSDCTIVVERREWDALTLKKYAAAVQFYFDEQVRVELEAPPRQVTNKLEPWEALKRVADGHAVYKRGHARPITNPDTALTCVANRIDLYPTRYPGATHELASAYIDWLSKPASDHDPLQVAEIRLALLYTEHGYTAERFQAVLAGATPCSE